MMLKYLEARYLIVSKLYRAETDYYKQFQLDAELKAVFSLLAMFRKVTQQYYTLKILSNCLLVKLRILVIPLVPADPISEEVKTSPQLSVVPNPGSSNTVEVKQADVSNLPAKDNG